MFSQINHYLAYQGLKYVKPEKAGTEADAMRAFKEQGQAARAEMRNLSKALSQDLPGFKIDPCQQLGQSGSNRTTTFLDLFPCY